MESQILNSIINKLRMCNFNPHIIYINFKTYNLLQDEIQETSLIDYNSPTINALANLMLVVDKDLEDNEIRVE